jgi:hypothetical protein
MLRIADHVEVDRVAAELILAELLELDADDGDVGRRGAGAAGDADLAAPVQAGIGGRAAVRFGAAVSAVGVIDRR